MSLPSLWNILWGFWCRTAYKSPGGAPFSPASPSPAILNLVSSSAPLGISISSFLTFLTTPVPSQAAHSFFINWPVPLHLEQVVVDWNIPKAVFLVFLSTPVPLQFAHLTI